MGRTIKFNKLGYFLVILIHIFP